MGPNAPLKYSVRSNTHKGGQAQPE
jgi:hypothetical protein